jgi:hypothetical protein
MVASSEGLSVFERDHERMETAEVRIWCSYQTA